jgi:hypothetical protein
MTTRIALRPLYRLKRSRRAGLFHRHPHPVFLEKLTALRRQEVDHAL